MKRNLLVTILLAVAIAALSSICNADELAATAPATSEPDKNRCTLFNPVPSDQLREMDTDRPNATNTPHTIDAGHVQIETGLIDYSYFRDHSSGDNVRSDDFSSGQLNFRLGVLNNLEINAVMNAYDNVRTHDYAAHATSQAQGFGDSILGAKLNLWGDEGGDDVWATALALQPQFKFPTARSDVGNGRFEFTVAAPFLINLPAGFHLGIQSGVSCDRDTGNTGYVTAFPNSISLDRVVIGNLDVYLEYAANPTTQSHVKTPQTIDVGATLPIGDNITLDAGVNVGLNRASNTVEVLAGISVRI